MAVKKQNVPIFSKLSCQRRNSRNIRCRGNRESKQTTKKANGLKTVLRCLYLFLNCFGQRERNEEPVQCTFTDDCTVSENPICQTQKLLCRYDFRDCSGINEITETSRQQRPFLLSQKEIKTGGESQRDCGSFNRLPERST